MTAFVLAAFIGLLQTTIPAQQPAPIQFDIPAGPLADTLIAFERTTGAPVRTGVSLDQLTSRGVRGALTPADALARLVEGTGLTSHPAAGGFVLEPATAPHRVETTGRLAHYVAEQSTTATRTNTRLLDVPQTVHVVPRALLDDQRAQSVADAVRNVPGVSIAQGEGNRDQLVLRGISTASDFFVNGIRDDQERFRDLYNVDSVEVVQGPAAVLFGRGGGGGVVNLVTTAAMPGTPNEINVEIGEYQHKRATARFGTSLGSRAFVRVAAMGEDSNGFRDSYFLRRHAINPVATVKVGTDSTLTLSFEHLRDHRLADRGIPSRAGRPADVPSSQLFGSRDQNDATSGVDGAGVTLEHRVSRSVRLRNNFLAGRYDKFYQNVYPGTAVNDGGVFSLAAYNHGVNRTNVFNQTDLIVEGRLGGVAHVLLAGIEAGRQSQDEDRHTPAPIADVPVTDSVRNAAFATAPLTIDRMSTGTTLAAYVQDQVSLFAQWKAVAGLRVDRFAVAVDDRMPANIDLSRVDVAASPRVGLIYQPNARTSIYTSYSYTFIPSGERLGLAVNTAQLRPENARNYEAGTKLNVLQSRLTLAAALFRLDRNDVKSVDPSDPTRLVLTGQQRTNGATFSAAGRINSRWELSAGYAALDARITKTTTAAPPGRRPGLVPRHQASLWTAHDITNAFRLAAGIVSQSDTFTSFTNSVRLPRYTRVDASAFYRMKNATLSIGVTNLFDASYYPTANGDNNISPGAPRTALASLRLAIR